MYTILAFLGAVLIGAGMTYVLGTTFGRQETYPPLSPGAAYESHYDNLSQSAITAENIADIQFGMSLRGYTMSEVDLYMKRIEEKLAWYEENYGVAAAGDGSSEKDENKSVNNEINETVQQEQS